MKKIVSLITCCFILFTCTCTFSSCFINREYRGPYKELYTVAVYSIPDTWGYMYHGEGAYSADIYVWEQDNYGRTLFAYCEDYGNQIFALVVSQGYDESKVYFYPDANYALTVLDYEHLYEGADDDHLKSRTEDFYLQTKDALKEQNDWNKPLDKSKCVSYSIITQKSFEIDAPELNSIKCNEILNEYSKTLNLVNSEKTPHRTNRILQVDAEGKALHCIYGVHQNYDKKEKKKDDEYTWYSITLWAITDKDGNYDAENGVMVMYSEPNESEKIYTYSAKDILDFKTKNNWKYPYADLG